MRGASAPVKDSAHPAQDRRAWASELVRSAALSVRRPPQKPVHFVGKARRSSPSRTTDTCGAGAAAGGGSLWLMALRGEWMRRSGGRRMCGRPRRLRRLLAAARLPALGDERLSHRRRRARRRPRRRSPVGTGRPSTTRRQRTGVGPVPHRHHRRATCDALRLRVVTSTAPSTPPRSSCTRSRSAAAAATRSSSPPPTAARSPSTRAPASGCGSSRPATSAPTTARRRSPTRTPGGRPGPPLHLRRHARRLRAQARRRHRPRGPVRRAGRCASPSTPRREKMDSRARHQRQLGRSPPPAATTATRPATRATSS